MHLIGMSPVLMLGSVGGVRKGLLTPHILTHVRLLPWYCAIMLQLDTASMHFKKTKIYKCICSFEHKNIQTSKINYIDTHAQTEIRKYKHSPVCDLICVLRFSRRLYALAHCGYCGRYHRCVYDVNDDEASLDLYYKYKKPVHSKKNKHTKNT